MNAENKPLNWTRITPKSNKYVFVKFRILSIFCKWMHFKFSKNKYQKQNLNFQTYLNFKNNETKLFKINMKKKKLRFYLYLSIGLIDSQK